MRDGVPLPNPHELALEAVGFLNEALWAGDFEDPVLCLQAAKASVVLPLEGTFSSEGHLIDQSSVENDRDAFETVMRACETSEGSEGSKSTSLESVPSFVLPLGLPNPLMRLRYGRRYHVLVKYYDEETVQGMLARDEAEGSNRMTGLLESDSSDPLEMLGSPAKPTPVRSRPKSRPDPVEMEPTEEEEEEETGFWYYIDKHGKLQGPHKGMEMRVWLEEGVFSDETQIAQVLSHLMVRVRVSLS